MMEAARLNLQWPAAEDLLQSRLFIIIHRDIHHGMAAARIANMNKLIKDCKALRDAEGTGSAHLKGVMQPQHLQMAMLQQQV